MIEELLDKFVEDNYDMIYSKVCEIFPDIVHSDFYLEDIDAQEFVENYMMKEYESWKQKHLENYMN